MNINKFSYYSEYSKEMRKILKEKENKIKKQRKLEAILIILLLISMIFTSIFSYKYEQKLDNLNKNLIEKEEEINRLNNKLNSKNIEINNKNEEFNEYKTEKENELNELNEKISFYEEQTKNIENNTTSKINLNNSDFKSWMPYTAITDTSSKQYEITRNAVPDENGLLKINDFYCVALGSVYGEVGDYFTVNLDNGNSFNVIKADEKADIHTIGDNKTSLDGSQIEFIVNKNCLNSDVKTTGNISVINKFSGNITSINKLYI